MPSRTKIPPRNAEPQPARSPREILEQVGETLFSGGSAQDAKILREAQKALDRLLPVEDPRDPKARKRARILQAATEQFIRNGFRKTSMDDVARAAHVAKGTLYLYFPTKAELLAAAISKEKLDQSARVGAVLASKLRGVELLRAWLHALFSTIQDMPLTQRLLRGDSELYAALDAMAPLFQMDPRDMQLRGYSAMIERCLGKQLAQERLDELARVICGLTYSIPTLFDPRLRGELSAERYTRVVVDTFVDGIAASLETGGKR